MSGGEEKDLLSDITFTPINIHTPCSYTTPTLTYNDQCPTSGLNAELPTGLFSTVTMIVKSSTKRALQYSRGTQPLLEKLPLLLKMLLQNIFTKTSKHNF